MTFVLDASVTLSPEEGLRLEEAIQRTILGKPNQLEAVAAGMSKRAPKFRDPQ